MRSALIRCPLSWCMAAMLLALPRGLAYADQASGGVSLEPRIEVAQPVFDFGTVAQGSKVSHDFKIKNTGRAPLKIRKIHPSCGCTAVVAESDEVLPGTVTIVRATFDTTGFQGEKMKTVRLYTNDPSQISTLLTLRGTVRPDVLVEPVRLNFGNVPRSKAHTVTAEVSIDRRADAKITSVQSRSDKIEVTSEDISPKGKAGTRVKITATLKEKLPPGMFRSRIVIKTDSERNPVINLPVYAFVHGALRLEPSSISFGLKPGPLPQALEGEAHLISTDAPVRIVSVEGDHPSVTAEYSVLEEGRKYVIKVKIAEGASGVLRARVTIVTDYPDEEEREVILPVYAIISKEAA